MKIVLIGHFCVDRFPQPGGTEERRLGGIFHSAAALANIASERDTIIPVAGIGENDVEMVRAAFSSYKNVDLSGLLPYAGPSNVVQYSTSGDVERTVDLPGPIPFLHIKKFLSADAVYVNMITGTDITVDTLDEIRLEIRGKKIPLHLDLHSVTVTVNPDGTRVRTPMADWRRWCFMTESIQMNREEAAGLSVERFSDELLTKQMIPLMVKAFIITRGADDAILFQEEHKQLRRTDIPNEHTTPAVSTVGAGDIFGAALMYAVAKKKNYADAAVFAQSAASFSTTFPPEEKHARLRSMREKL